MEQGGLPEKGGGRDRPPSSARAAALSKDAIAGRECEMHREGWPGIGPVPGRDPFG